MKLDTIRSTDSPIEEKRDDKFDRYHFAESIAGYLVAAKDPASFAIGLYGSWGSGKTSLLNFIELELRKHEPGLQLMRFNPWLFDTESKLLLDFFGSLKNLFRLSRSKRLRKMGVELLDTYGGALTTTLKLITGVDAKGLLDFLVQKDVHRARRDLAQALREGGVQFVVLMDDIDRLDDAEIQAVFRLVKLTGDLPNIRYVLTFDPQIVASALDKRYHTTGQSGSNFLEKIVQLPAHLPVLRDGELHTYIMGCVDDALALHSFSMANSERQCLEKIMADAVRHRVTTPRTAKRYGYALGMAYQRLWGEVDPLDLSVLEAIRVLYAPAYEVLRDHRSVFVDARRTDEREFYLSKTLEGFLGPERSHVEELLSFMFPIVGNSRWEHPSQQVGQGQRNLNSYDWKRISERFFVDRYFTYSIAPGEISESTLEELFARCEEWFPLDLTQFEQAAEVHIRRLVRALEDILRKSTGRRLLDQLLPHGFMTLPGYAHAAVVTGVTLALIAGRNILCTDDKGADSLVVRDTVADLVKRFFRKDADGLFLIRRGEQLVMFVATKIEPVNIADEFCHAILWSEKNVELPGSGPSEFWEISSTVRSQCATALSDRIASQTEFPETDDNSLWRQKPKIVQELLSHWQLYSSQEVVRNHFTELIARRPFLVWKLLDWFPPDLFSPPFSTRLDHYFDLNSLDLALRRELGNECNSDGLLSDDANLSRAQAFWRYRKLRQSTPPH